jgi:hypothetical protein
MLTIATIDLIGELFRAGKELGDIASAADCSENTVRTVIASKHPLQLRPAAKPKPAQPPRRVSLAAPERCAGCGGLITQAPCVLCAALAEDV